MTIGDAIRVARKARGLGQVEAAQTAGIAVNSWRLYEGDKRSPTCETLDRIAHALSVPVSSLVPDFASEIERLTDRCARYAEEIAVLQERTRWIPVEERLPEMGEMVLAIACGKPMETVTLIHSLEMATLYNDGWFLETWPGWEHATVTHWMPLPARPEVE